eukprot:TRINITY_DN27888_c0_g3_i1.p3 TRINITY_DN27888_c0_g3~~TRINITY_DN27888_c0_g3_i1.p3  ORF type:complete len:150 (+),score=8.14 TRINITY_DN27888_c0_g3_i1:239-688(+)
MRNIVSWLGACFDKDTFEQQFIEYLAQKIQTFESPQDWVIWGSGVAFEPYTFKGIELYNPYFSNERFSDEGYKNLVDSYSYYIDCEEVFGDDCTWYNKGKLYTYYKGVGGIWFNKRQFTDSPETIWSFYTPVILNGRYYGIVALDAITK